MQFQYLKEPCRPHFRVTVFFHSFWPSRVVREGQRAAGLLGRQLQGYSLGPWMVTRVEEDFLQLGAGCYRER